MLEEIKKAYKTANATLNPSQVGYVIFYVTNRCNFRCKFCFYYAEIEKGRKPEELTLEEIDKISKSTGSLLQLSLTGGEPFLRKDFAELTNIWIKNTGVRFVTIPTNASLKDRMIRYLHEVLPKHPSTFFRLAFSIDGISEEHDLNRFMPGSYNKIIECYNEISPLREKYHNLILDTNTVFTSSTEGKILEILTHLNENFEFDNHTVTYARGDIKDENLKSDAKNEYIKMNEFLNNLERKKEKRFMYPAYRAVRDVAWKNLMSVVFDDKFVTPCVAGRKLIVISETGVVRPCEMLDKTIGDLRDYNFDVKKLMASQEKKELADWIIKSKCKCSFECAHAANVVWNFSEIPKIIKEIPKNIGKSRRSYSELSRDEFIPKAKS